MLHPSPDKKSHKKDNGWNKVSKWYDRLVGPSGSEYHQKTIIPGALKILKAQKGEKILDLACGQGVFCRALAKLGVQVTGVDVSEKMIQLACRHPQGLNNIDYKIADSSHLKGIPSENFDALVSLLSIQNTELLEETIREATRVTKKNARWVWVMNHPCFRIPRQSGWGYEEQRKLQYRRIDRYMTPLKIPIQMHPGRDPHLVTWSFHRPLSSYAQTLYSYGWAITHLEEWTSHKKSQPGARARAENLARNEIPLFLALCAVKIFSRDGRKNVQ